MNDSVLKLCSLCICGLTQSNLPLITALYTCVCACVVCVYYIYNIDFEVSYILCLFQDLIIEKMGKNCALYTSDQVLDRIPF